MHTYWHLHVGLHEQMHTLFTNTHKCMFTHIQWLIVLLFIWCFNQWFISIARPGNCLQNACSEKTHSDDLGQIEALPSATDNSGSERRQNFKERGRDCLKTRCTLDDKTRELISTQRSSRQINTLLSLCSWNEYSQSKLFTFSTPSNM